MNTGSMTKAELVEEVSRVSDLTKKHSEVIVDTVFKSIIDALHRGEKIELRGFGSFRLRQREPRKGRNPKTGDKVDVPPKKVPYFKPGKELKDLLNRDADALDAAADDAGRPAGPPAGPSTPDALSELMTLVRDTERVLTTAYAPHGINVGLNLGRAAGAGVADHLHVHLVPRWNGDTNFMTVVADARVLPETLDQTAARLRP